METSPSDTTCRHSIYLRDLCTSHMRNALSHTNEIVHKGGDHFLQQVTQFARERNFLLKLDAPVPPDQLVAKARECYDRVCCDDKFYAFES